MYVYNSKAQDYPQLDTVAVEQNKQTLEEYKLIAEKFELNITNTDNKKMNKYLSEFYENHQKAFVEDIEAGNFVYDKRYLDYSNEIVKSILEANNLSKENYHILISRNPTLNAYCTIDGYIVLNLGLFYYLQNDAQVAGVIAHELAHKVLDHSLNDKRDYFINDIATKKEKAIMKEVLKADNVSRAVQEALKKTLYKKRERNRKQELEADSAGYALYRNTDYNKYDFIGALDLYVQYDTIKPNGLKPDTYKKLYDLPEQPFKNEWFDGEDFSMYDYSKYEQKYNKDSLSTHPESQERIKHLYENYPELEGKTEKSKQSEKLKELEEVAFYAIIPTLYDKEAYGVAVYNIMVAIQNETNPEFFKPWLGKCFDKMYEAQKKYELNKHLDNINPTDQSESYKQFLSFMWNLSLSELKTITEHYKTNDTSPSPSKK